MPAAGRCRPMSREPSSERGPRGMRWYVYILRCADATLYTGVTNSVTARLDAHNAGRGAKYTRGRRPVELVYVETVDGRGAALRREAQIKRLAPDAKRRLLDRGGLSGGSRRAGPGRRASDAQHPQRRQQPEQ